MMLRRQQILRICFFLVAITFLKVMMSTPGPSFVPASYVRDQQETVKEAIVTIITNDAYIPAALVLGHTLHKYGAAKNRAMIAMVLSNSTINSKYIRMLEIIGWRLTYVKPIPVPGKTFPQFADLLAKFYAWNMTQFTAVGLLDSDSILTGSIEEAFHVMRANRNISLAAAEVPLCIPVGNRTEIFTYVNAGILFLRPNVHDYHELVLLSSNNTKYDLNYPEQSVINTYYNRSWYTLPIVYNLLFFERERFYWPAERNKARIIHFAGGPKPWIKQNTKLLHETARLWREEFSTVMKSHNWTREDFSNGTSKHFMDIFDFGMWAGV